MKEIVLEVEASAVEYNGYLYFSESGINGLLRLNIQTGKTELLAFFEKEERKDALFRNAYRYKNEAWFVPWRAKHIVCVNLDTLNMEYFEIPYLRRNTRGENTYPYTVYYSAGRISEEEIFLIPMSNDTPVVINMETKAIKSYFGIIDVEREVMGYGVAIDGKIWMYPYFGNRLIILDYKTSTLEEMPWIYKDLDYAGMIYHDKEIWFAPFKADNILKYDIVQQTYIKLPLDELYQDGYSYWEVVFYDNRIWFLPKASEKMIFYETKKGQWGYINKNPEMWHFYPLELRKIEAEDALMIVSCRTGYLLVYQPSEKNFKNIKVCIEREELYERMQEKCLNQREFAKNFLVEDGTVSETYLGLEYYPKLTEDLKVSKQECENFGKAIWRFFS